MSALFRWLHLSDIHVGHGDAEHGWDQKLVMDTLRRDVAKQVAAEQSPLDAILVTGDIAFSGASRSKTEYEEAGKWLGQIASGANVPVERVFLVPGNHDVSRSGDREMMLETLLDSLSQGLQSLDRVLDNAGGRAALAKRMEAYLAFAAGFGAKTSELFYHHALDAREGLRVHLAALNTSLLARGDEDLGRLRLGKQQIVKTLVEPEIGPNELVIALTHHPLRAGWLADEREMDELIRSRAHVHLSGHVHEAASEWAGTGGGGAFVRVVAGSAHGEKQPKGVPATHGYSFGAVLRGKDGKAEIRIHPRKWSDRNKDFRVDVDNVPEGSTFARHELSLVLPTASRGAATAAAGPVRIYFSYAAEDDAARARIENVYLKPLRKAGDIEIRSGGSLASDEEAERAVDEAELVVFLLSFDFLASDRCAEIELPRALARAAKSEAIVLPVLLRACDYEKHIPPSILITPRTPVHPETKPHPQPADEVGRDRWYVEVLEQLKKAIDLARSKRR